MGVTPSANQGQRSLNIGNYTGTYTAVTSGASGTGYGVIGYNVGFTSTTNSYKALASDYMSWLNFDAGTFKFFQTGSVAGGSTQTGTQAMTLDASGNLLVGITSGASGLISAGPVTNKTGLFGSANTATYAGIQGAHTVNSATGYVAYFANSGSSTGLYISNTAAWQSTSDERLKTDIQDLDSTKRLMQLRPRDYLWKSQETSDNPTKRNLGFIAQEIKDIFPELVGVSPDGMFSVEYTGLIAPLVKAIQEQQALITQLTARITALEGA